MGKSDHDLYMSHDELMEKNGGENGSFNTRKHHFSRD